MNEQDIKQIVETVLTNGKPKEHKCTCVKNITLDYANALIEKVKAKAKEMGLSVVVAVSDSAGHIVSVQSMDDAYIASYDVAVNKTFTSVSLKMSTDELSRLSGPGQPLYGIQNTNQGKIVIFGGGEPLMVKGKIIGALGVSGGSAAQDTALAAYGKDILEEVIKCQ
ncbi:MAG TPA: heme-binding protein [Candidatus Dorea intestinavium]|nr:heme-binding protein [Candidatus Dorea intestinavium]